jgi:hypothetical protein
VSGGTRLLQWVRTGPSVVRSYVSFRQQRTSH